MIFKLALRNLARNPRRSLITLTTISVGIGALFLFDGFNTGIMNQYKANTIHARFGHGQINTKGYRDQIFEKPWEHWIAADSKILQSAEKAKEVRYIFPRVEFFGLLTNDKINVSGKGVGVKGSIESEFFHTINIVEGSNLGQDPMGIVLGLGLARALGIKIGDRVTVLTQTVHGTMNGSDFNVSGIFHTGTKEVDDTLFRIELEQAQQLLDTNQIESIAIGLHKDEDWSTFANFIKRDFPDFDVTPFAVLDKVYYQHAVDWLASQYIVFQMIILFIVILGIFNTVSFTVLERTREFANLRANGESKTDILSLISAEGVFTGLIGAFLGISLAYFLHFTLLRKGILMPPAPGLTRQYYVQLELRAGMAIFAFFLGIFVAVSASFLAGFKAVTIKVADGLRHL